MKNPILFIVDASNNFLRYTGTIRALNGYTEQIVFITPQPILNTYISASMLPVNRNDNRYEQYVLPSSDKVSDYIEATDALYQTIADWNVFKTDIKQTALAEFSKFRSGNISFAFAIQSVEASSKLILYKGVFGVDNPLPTSGQTIGDYYECEDSDFTLVSGAHTYVFSEGMYVYWNGSRWVKDRLMTLGSTTSVQIPVEPNHAVGYELEDDEVLAVENTIAQVVVNTGDIADLKQKDSDILSGVEPFGEITLKDALNNQTSITYASKEALDIEVARLETDKADKTYVDSQNALDEKLSNKATDFAVVNDTLYPSVSAVKTYVDGADNLKEDLVNKATNFSVIDDIKYPTTEAVKEYVDTRQTSVYDFKGSVLFANLPITGQKVGDTYNITDDFTLGGEDYLAGTNVAWNGTGWDALGSHIPIASEIDSVHTGNTLTNVDLNVQADIDELDAKHEALDGRVGTLETDNTQNKADIVTLETNVQVAQNDLIDHEQRIDSIEAITRKQDSDIASVDDDGIGIMHMGKDVAETTVTTKIEGLLLDSANTFNLSSTTVNGVTVTVSGNQVTLSGTASAETTLILASGLTATNKAYVNQDYISGTSSLAITLKNGATSLNATYNTDYSGVVVLEGTTVTLVIANGAVLSSVIYKFNINVATTLIANKQYSPLYSTTFDLMSDAQIKAQMDLWVQDGTLPNSIMSVDMDKRVTSVGKNLFDGLWELGTIIPSTGIESSSSVKIRTSFIKVKPSTTYVMSSTDSTNDDYKYYYDINKVFISSSFGAKSSFTTPSNCYYVRFIQDVGTTNIQLEANTVATTYEPYRSSSMYLDSGEVGYSLPNSTKDTIEFRNGQAYHVQMVKKYTLQASDFSTLTKLGVDIVRIYKQTNHSIYNNSTRNITNSNTLYISGFVNKADYTGNSGELFIYGALDFGITFPLDTYASLAEAQADLVGTDIYYQLSTPIETPISVIGNAMAYPNGTFLIEDVVRRSGVYSSGITVDKAIKTLDNIYKLNADGSSTKLDVSGATVAGDGLSFTHTSLSNGDFVWFDYYYQGTNVKGLSTVYYYGDKMIVADTTTGTVYKIIFTIDNGVITVDKVAV